MVPIHLDALVLKLDRSIIEPMADFTRLPYFDGMRDVNPGSANISEEILSQPFQDQGFQLKAGIHLHWALPDALTRGIRQEDQHNRSQPGKLAFPAVPNRWLVTRTDANKKQKQWVIESDYLYPPGQGDIHSSISYPYLDNSHPQLFRFLGRTLSLAAWKNRESGAKYLDKLTAVGYGEPAFAAFYPNCHSVFGFYDDEAPQDLQEVQYDVIGWYGDPTQDCLQINALAAARDKAAKYQVLQDQYRWLVKSMDNPFPAQTICYACLTFQENPSNQFVNNSSEEQEVDVAVGNTSTEALSAYLAYQRVQATQPNLSVEKFQTTCAELEDQLEALHLADRLEGKKLDIGFKFKEARHEKEFTAVSGGKIWTIRIGDATSDSLNPTETVEQTQITLPGGLAHALNQLNIQQQAYDRDGDEIESLQKQLFADWYKYMLCLYPPEDNRDDYPNVDQVKHFIEKNSLFPLKHRIARNKALGFQCQETVKQVYKAVAELQFLKVESIQDWTKFRAVFQTTPRSTAVVRVFNLLSEPIKTFLNSTNKIDNVIQQQQATIQDLNKILAMPNFYDSAAFGAPETLTGEIKKLQSQLSQQPIADQPYHQVLRLNRLLLEVTFLDIAKSNFYVLQPLPAPRYWLPNEPVVLIADKANKTVQQSLRHGQDGRLHEDGLLECHILSEAAINQNPEEIRARIQYSTLNPIGTKTWTEQPWHPFLLEWEVEVFPLKGKYRDIAANMPYPLTRNYDSECITENYQLAKDAVDLTIQLRQETLAKEANIYIGRSILTPHAQIQLKQQIDDFLTKALLSDYYEAKSVKPSERINGYFENNRKDIIDWYNAQPAEKKNDVINQILAINDQLSDSFYALAQSLGGFNEALLMHKQTLQLPIEDPFEFADYQSFTESVQQVMGSGNRVAPQPHNDFNPIRTGILKIRQLRLVDTFGQVQPLGFKNDEVITTDAMTTPASPYLIMLPPRLVQPARLNFRWLSAQQELLSASRETNNNGAAAPPSPADEVEMNAHPATTPICGWLLPNHLDNSLMVYDAAGQALGAIGQDCQWLPAPGQRAITLAEVANANFHLHKLITHIIHQGSDFLSAFLTVVESALDTIDPENAMQHQAIALLMGRPIAVVRVRLDLELQGVPAFDQGWNAFRQEVECELECEAKGMHNSCLHHTIDQHTGAVTILRETQNFTQVKFPIRIGEYRQLNDGLIGFWQEQPKVGGYEYTADFYINDTKSGKDDNRNSLGYANIHYYADEPDILQSIDSAPQIFTMLVDPRGSVHATSGILPTKSIQIPADQFTDALRNLEVTFLSAPILSDQGSINLPLPTEPGYVWSWVDKEDGVWHLKHKIGTVSTQATFSAQQELKEGWLKLTQTGE
ncbi:hypothetical protein AMR41_07990 [Hapalosiphon sp. MRB220]|nr:hypothetical protein AMR41_07990 [Hapalosiphon sp. MRB220]